MADKRIEDFDTLTTLTGTLLTLVADDDNDETYNTTLATLASYVISVLAATEGYVDWDNLDQELKSTIAMKLGIGYVATDSTMFNTYTEPNKVYFGTYTNGVHYHFFTIKDFNNVLKTQYRFSVNGIEKRDYDSENTLWGAWANIRKDITLEELASSVYESTPTNGSSKLLTSGGAYTALFKKLDYGSTLGQITKAQFDALTLTDHTIYYAHLDTGFLYTNSPDTYAYIITSTSGNMVFIITLDFGVFKCEKTNGTWGDCAPSISDITSINGSRLVDATVTLAKLASAVYESTPTNGSSKLLTSGGAYTALQKVVGTLINTGGGSDGLTLNELNAIDIPDRSINWLFLGANILYTGQVKQMCAVFTVNSTTEVFINTEGRIFKRDYDNVGETWGAITEVYAVASRVSALESTVGTVDAALQEIIDGGVSNE